MIGYAAGGDLLEAYGRAWQSFDGDAWVGLFVKDAVECLWWLSKTPWPKANNQKVLQEYSPDMQRLLERGYRAKERPSGHRITRDDDSLGEACADPGATDVLGSAALAASLFPPADGSEPAAAGGVAGISRVLAALSS